MEKYSKVKLERTQAPLSPIAPGEDAKRVRSPASSSQAKKQSLFSRMLWFCAGAGVKYFVILLPFNFLKAHTSLSTIVISGISLAVSTGFFFFWNYFLNFRTESSPREALPRYLAAASFMWLASTLLLSSLKGLNLCRGFKIGNYPVDVDIIIMQALLSGVKFLLYHKWAFPAQSKVNLKRDILAQKESVVPDRL
ncbi:MAG: hypothetical protein ACP5IL_00585 [Syntrophobacteraceae bacterium]